MSSIIERQNDILGLITQLDITPTMHKNAEEKYHALATFLESCNISADIYPQGSFALGTVVRPTVKDPDANYDLDFICQVHMTRDAIAPSSLRQKIEDALKSSDRYGGKLTTWNECFTIEYADINGIGFSIDVVPATAESTRQIEELTSLSHQPELIRTSIAIPRENGGRNYNWITNNPKGYKVWFDNINAPFLAYRREERRSVLFENNRAIYNSVEEIPPAVERSAMQRVIQMLKFHRDNFYQNLPRDDKDDIKPISAILNTLVAGICKSASPYSDTFALLTYVLDTLEIYAKQQSVRFEEFQRYYRTYDVITRADGKWLIQNPANPKDNLANKWNSNPEIPKIFFRWVSACRKDLVESIKLPDALFFTEISNAFGADVIQKRWGAKYNISKPKSINIDTASKPYLSL